MTTPTEKRCPACEVVKDIDDFHRCRTRPDGRVGWCKECVRTYAKRPDQRKARAAAQRRYADRNRETMRVSTNRWYLANRDQILARRKATRDARKAEQAALAAAEAAQS